MTEQDRLTALTQILSDLLGDETLVLTMDTVRDDVPGWGRLYLDQLHCGS